MKMAHKLKRPVEITERQYKSLYKDKARLDCLDKYGFGVENEDWYKGFGTDRKFDNSLRRAVDRYIKRNGL